MTGTLAARDIEVRYPRHQGLLARLRGGNDAWLDVVRGVGIEIGRGETLAVVGESGSGKTTLAMALMGLVPMHAGRAGGCARNGRGWR